MQDSNDSADSNSSSNEQVEGKEGNSIQNVIFKDRGDIARCLDGKFGLSFFQRDRKTE